MRDAVLCCRLIRICFCFVLFLNNLVVLVMELSVVIFQLVFFPWLLCAECKKIVVSLGVHIPVHYVRNGGHVPIVGCWM